MSTSKPHKHAAVIKAWADGAQVQYKYPGEETWHDIAEPSWKGIIEYRIKPECKPDIVGYGQAVLQPGNKTMPTLVKVVDGGTVRWPSDNVKFTFDGETNELKNVELIKKG
jgi:hypothetical protein